MIKIDLTTPQEVREFLSMFMDKKVGGQSMEKVDNGMVGKYVIVRCRDAGVHAGVLESYDGRSCVLSESRRLWYWKPANNALFLSGVATEGLHEDSKVGAPCDIHLTENCEIILCSAKAESSIREKVSHEQ